MFAGKLQIHVLGRKLLPQELAMPMSAWIPAITQRGAGPVITAQLRVAPCLAGGKGGFGASVRAAGKRAKQPAALDFGACRDLQGRRLRYVNDVMRHAAWSAPDEQKKRARLGEAYAEPAGSSGLAGWHLPVPAWADVSAMTSSGQGTSSKAAVRAQRAVEKRAASAAKQEADKKRHMETVYMDFEHNSATPAAMSKAVISGLRAGQKRPAAQSLGAAPEIMEVALFDSSASSESDSGGEPSSAAAAAAAAAATIKHSHEARPASAELGGSAMHWAVSFGNEADCHMQLFAPEGSDKHSAPVTQIEGVSGFQSFVAAGPAGAPTAGRLWFEVALAGNGLVQVGVADPAFSPAAADNDGVGDDEHSWGVDGARGLIWHAGASKACAEGGRGSADSPPAWSAGDVIGVGVDYARGELTVWRNGTAYCTVYDLPRGAPLAPALSIDPGVAVRWNLGAGGWLADCPDGYTAFADAMWRR